MPPPIQETITREQWDLLVWHFVALSEKPNGSAAGRLAGLDYRRALHAWEKGYKAHGDPIKVIRADIAAGRRPFPVRPVGAPEATSRLAKRAARRKTPIAAPPLRRPAAPPPAARPAPAPEQAEATPPPDDPTDPDAGDPWVVDDLSDVAGALGQVPFPGDESAPAAPPAPPPRAPRRPAFRTVRIQAERDAAADSLSPDELDPGAPPEIPDPCGYEPLPSEAAAAKRFVLPPIERALAEQVLLEARMDLINLGARSRRSAALAIYSTQTLLTGIIPLSERIRDELKALAEKKLEAGEVFDAAAAVQLMERAMRVARGAHTLSTGASSQAKAITSEIALHLRTIEPTAGTGEGGEMTDEELLAAARHEGERFAREQARLERIAKERAGQGGGEDPPAPPAPEGGETPAPEGTPGTGEAPAAPEPPPPSPEEALAAVLTEEALLALVDVDTAERGRGCLDDGRVAGWEIGEDGALVGMVVGALGSMREYTTRLWAADGALAHDCTCPQGQLGRACKHGVALGLAWLGRPRG